MNPKNHRSDTCHAIGLLNECLDEGDAGPGLDVGIAEGHAVTFPGAWHKTASSRFATFIPPLPNEPTTTSSTTLR